MGAHNCVRDWKENRYVQELEVIWEEVFAGLRYRLAKVWT